MQDEEQAESRMTWVVLEPVARTRKTGEGQVWRRGRVKKRNNKIIDSGYLSESFL